MKKIKPKKRKFKFGDKVHDWLDKINYVVVKKTRGNYYFCVDKEADVWKIMTLRLHRNWVKK